MTCHFEPAPGTLSAAMPPAMLPTADKAYRTFQAALALRGWSLHSLDANEGGNLFLASRWGMSRTLRDLAAVASFANTIGAPL